MTTTTIESSDHPDELFDAFAVASSETARIGCPTAAISGHA
jgi:hypothetical protein